MTTKAIATAMTTRELAIGIGQYFQGYQPRLFITLNDKVFVKHLSAAEMKKARLDQRAEVLMDWLGQRISPRSEDRNEDPNCKAIFFTEVGTDSGLLHNHIILATKHPIERSIEDLNLFVNRTWVHNIYGNFGRIGSMDRPFKCPENAGIDKFLRAARISMNTPAQPGDHEPDSSTKVVAITSFAECFEYSTKQFYWLQQNQFCPVTLH